MSSTLLLILIFKGLGIRRRENIRYIEVEGRRDEQNAQRVPCLGDTPYNRVRVNRCTLKRYVR